jgi:hypothetical protein
MRTKALLLAAAVTVATCATSMAQVYSANAVGYVNVTLPAGFNIIANPLNGTNNDLGTVLPLPAAASGATLYTFDATTQLYSPSTTYFPPPTGWFPPGKTLPPGTGAFLDVPLAAAPLNITFVGEVPQGQLSVQLIGGGYNLVASEVPQALPLGEAGAAGTLEFPAASGDAVYFFDANSQQFSAATTFFGGTTGWFPPPAEGPTVPVATGFFVNKAGGDVGWDRDFSVN